MVNNEFRILVDSIRIAMSEDERGSIESSVNVILGKYTNNWKESTYSSQNLKKLYYKGLNHSASQKIKDAVINEDSFRRYVDQFDDIDKEAIALKLQTINKDGKTLEISEISYFCVNLLNRLVEDARTKQQKKTTKSGPGCCLDKTVADDSFDSVFKEITTGKIANIKNNNDIHAFILKPELFPFNYKKLEKLILNNITNYAVARGVSRNDVAGIKAAKILRDYAHSGVPENIMGEMLTYIFLEHTDNAHKIYTRAEISEYSRTIDSEGIYVKNDRGRLQLILGASQLHDDLCGAIQNVVSEMKNFRNNCSKSLIVSTDLIDKSILNEQYSSEESENILNVIIPNEDRIDEIAAYGLFIGYKFKSNIDLDECSTEEVKIECEKVIKNDFNQVMVQLNKEIKDNKWQKSSFYVYMLPFISAEKDGDKIMSNIIGGYDYARTK